MSAEVRMPSCNTHTTTVKALLSHPRYIRLTVTWLNRKTMTANDLNWRVSDFQDRHRLLGHPSIAKAVDITTKFGQHFLTGSTDDSHSGTDVVVRRDNDNSKFIGDTMGAISCVAAARLRHSWREIWPRGRCMSNCVVSRKVSVSFARESAACYTKAFSRLLENVCESNSVKHKQRRSVEWGMHQGRICQPS